jgi:pseudaminic acid biosynthesis-associated methylase
VKFKKGHIILQKVSRNNPWAGEFGRSYVDRNTMTSDELDRMYTNNFGISRASLNDEFLSSLNISTILEVGCNMGLQLELLRNRGYSHLYGLDISSYALGLLIRRIEQIRLVRSSALYIPFRNESFDLVFTSGVLIHVHPNNLSTAIDEIYRCSKRYIWCFEYYHESETEVEYRNKKGLLWKNNFLKIFTRKFPDLLVLRARKLNYSYNNNTDVMFLLEKHNTKSTP